MKLEQEPKYEAREGRLFNRASGEQIPDDEPVFILRARDVHAAKAIEIYALLCSDQNHVSWVTRRANDFNLFRRANPHRMKEPDSP